MKNKKQELYTDAAIDSIIDLLKRFSESNVLLQDQIDLVRKLHENLIDRLEQRITKLEEK